MGGGSSRSQGRYVATIAPEQRMVSEDCGEMCSSGSVRHSMSGDVPEGRLASKNSAISQRLMSFLGRPQDELKEFQPHVDFLRIIASPNTRLDLYLHTIVCEVSLVLDADRVSVFFVDEVRQEVWCVASTECEPFRLPWDRGIVGQSAREGKTMNIADVQSHWAFDRTVEKSTCYTVRTMLSMPIKHMVDEHRTVGVVQALNKKDGSSAPFTVHDENELGKIAMVISDSFYRQRWRAFETGCLHDRAALAVIAAHHQDPTSGLESPSAVDRHVALERFSWGSEPPPWQRGCGEDDPGIPMVALPSHPLTGVGAASASKLRTLEFDALACPPEDLVHMVRLVLDDTGCMSRCHVDHEVLRNWTWAARRLYRDNPYHNWFHGFATFQVCYYQVHASSLHSRLRYLDVFGLLLAALCHDLDHPGVTNSFLVQGESELALRYNDVSVLENHHAFLACELLRKDETAVAVGLGRLEQRELRKTMIRSILDTDMTHHRDLCQAVMARAAFADKDGEDEEDRQFWLSLCMHTSDLSGQCLPWPVAASWEARISQEFVIQADAEVARGLTPAPFMQFSYDDAKQRGKLQRDFIDFVLVPMYDPYTQLLPELRCCFDSLLHNRSLYDYRAANGADKEPVPEATL